MMMFISATVAQALAVVYKQDPLIDIHLESRHKITYLVGEPKGFGPVRRIIRVTILIISLILEQKYESVYWLSIRC